MDEEEKTLKKGYMPAIECEFFKYGLALRYGERAANRSGGYLLPEDRNWPEERRKTQLYAIPADNVNAVAVAAAIARGQKVQVDKYLNDDEIMTTHHVITPSDESGYRGITESGEFVLVGAFSDSAFVRFLAEQAPFNAATRKLPGKVGYECVDE